jgi:CDP-glucose 4,6-dehydratase
MMGSLAAFYADKKVLLTGHTGFKGGWLATWLKMMGASVIGFALDPETKPNLFRAADVAQGMTSIIGDVRNCSELMACFRAHKPVIVIHNAAQALVRRAYKEPVETYATNVMGTVHVLECARQTPSVRAVIIVTSDKCYENREQPTGYHEYDAMGGTDPYSSSKGAAELVTAAYRRSFFAGKGCASIASARAGNVIGGGDWSQDRLVPDIVRGIASGQPIMLRQPNSVRPWQHVLEPLRGYLLLGQRLCEEGDLYAQAWNFGPREDDAISVSKMAESIVSSWGEGELRILQQNDGPHEARLLRLNCDKAREELGWRPLLTTEQTISWTVDWYRNFYDDQRSAPSCTQKQIEDYVRVAN